MAKKKKFHDSSKVGGSSSIFPESNKITSVSSIPTGQTGPYHDTMEYADAEIRRNSNFKKKTD